MVAKKITSQKDLFDLALFYCSKRETSRSKMAQYLTRKCREQEIEEPSWITNVLDELERFKVIDDARYGDILTRNYQRAGKGKRYVALKLKEKGIAKEKFAPVHDDASEEVRATEVAQKTWARLLKQKIKIPQSHARFQNAENTIRKQKLMQKLTAAGFSYDLIKKVMGKL